MNYINRLQEENKALQAELDRKEEIVNELRRYVNSSKFRSGNELDGYVNVSDVINRLSDF